MLGTLRFAQPTLGQPASIRYKETGLCITVATGIPAAVARMQRSGIREERSVALPDYTAFHPGYGLNCQ